MNNEYTLEEVIKLASIGEAVLANELNKQEMTKTAGAIDKLKRAIKAVLNKKQKQLPPHLDVPAMTNGQRWENYPLREELLKKRQAIREFLENDPQNFAPLPNGKKVQIRTEKDVYPFFGLPWEERVKRIREYNEHLESLGK